MTNIPDDADLPAIAREAQVEIVTAENVKAAAGTPDAAGAFATTELGYYEAELRSLRDAALALDAAEHSPERQPPSRAELDASFRRKENP